MSGLGEDLMFSKKIVTVGVVAGCALLFTSCGDDAEALSKPEFIEQADAICQAASDELDLVFDEVFEGFDDLDVDDPATQDLIFDLFDEGMGEAEPIWNRQVDDLRDLVPPEEDRDLIEALLDDFEEAVAEFAELTEAAAAGDEAARAEFDEDDEDEDPFSDINRRSRDYGLVTCGDPG